MKDWRREIGFLATVRRIGWRGVFLAPEALGAAVFGLFPAAWFVQDATIEDAGAVAGDFLVISGALVGVIFAGLALIVGGFSGRHLLLFGKESIPAVLGPFVFAAGVQVTIIIGCVLYRGLPPSAEGYVGGTAFVVLATLFAYALFDVVALARNLVAHAVLRVGFAETDRDGHEDTPSSTER